MRLCCGLRAPPAGLRLRTSAGPPAAGTGPIPGSGLRERQQCQAASPVTHGQRFRGHRHGARHGRPSGDQARRWEGWTRSSLCSALVVWEVWGLGEDAWGKQGRRVGPGLNLLLFSREKGGANTSLPVGSSQKRGEDSPNLTCLSPCPTCALSQWVCSHPGQGPGRRPDSPSSLSSSPQLGRPHDAVSSSCRPCHCCPGSGLFPVRVASLQVPTHIPPNSTGHSKTYISGCPSLLKTFRGLATPAGRDPGFLRGLQTCYLASLALQPPLPPRLALGSP